MILNNSMFWLGFLLLHYLLPPLFLRLFGNRGLYVLLCLGLVLANLQVQKLVTIFGLHATLGNASYALSFLITDYFSETGGHRAAARAVWLGLVAQLTVMVLMLYALGFTPGEGDAAQPHLTALFLPIPQLLGASLLAYVISQWHDVLAYRFWRKLLPGRQWLWVRNNASTAVSQALDTLIFVTLAFSFGPLKLAGPMLVEVMLTTYLFKLIAALVDTPFLYIMTSRRFVKRESII